MKNKEKTLVIFITFVLVSLGLMGLDKLKWLDFLKRPVEKIVNPTREKIHQINSKQEKTSLTTCDSADLENKIANLTIKIEELEQENKAMRRLLGAPLPPDWQFTPAKVLNVKNGVMTIDQGSDIGIKENQIVVFENVLVGYVFKANPRLSKIILVNHKEMDIKAKIVESNIKGKLKTERERLFLDKVLQEKNLAVGQIVVTSGEDEFYPPNLLIGKIEEIEKNETAIYQKAILKPFLDYFSLDNVFILKNYP